jgi:hypothetical protein
MLAQAVIILNLLHEETKWGIKLYKENKIPDSSACRDTLSVLLKVFAIFLNPVV